MLKKVKGKSSFCEGASGAFQGAAVVLTSYLARCGGNEKQEGRRCRPNRVMMRAVVTALLLLMRPGVGAAQMMPGLSSLEAAAQLLVCDYSDAATASDAAGGELCSTTTAIPPGSTTGASDRRSPTNTSAPGGSATSALEVCAARLTANVIMFECCARTFYRGHRNSSAHILMAWLPRP